MRTRHLVPDPKQPKSVARADARAARAAFVGALAPAVRVALEAALADQLIPHLPGSSVLASYAAVADEIDPLTVETRAAALGWLPVFPRVTRGAPLAFHAIARAALVRGPLGIAEPPAGLPEQRPDVLLVPLLAVDAAGNRLGQGGGYYDRTLAALRKTGPVRAIGICWDVQRIDAVAVEAWDAPLDAVATPTAFHALRSGAKAGA